MHPRRVLAVFLASMLCPLAMAASVSVKVGFVTKRGQKPKADETIVWLEPLAGTRVAKAAPLTATVTTRSKTLLPNVIAVPVGSTIQFPNEDPISHNLFSLSPGNSFDLGLYRKGAGKSHKFTSPGVVNVYCNVHPNMSAVIHVVDTPLYTTTDATGAAGFANVPAGRYRVVAWNERVGSSQSEIELTADAASNVALTIDGRTLRPSGQHKNKFGQKYETPKSRDY